LTFTPTRTGASSTHSRRGTILSTDGKGIVMRHEDLREATRRAAEKGSRKLETRLTPGETSNRKRMAQVATVYSIAPFLRGPADILHTLRDAGEVDAKRPRPTDKRVWASVEKTARAVIRDAFEEARRRDPDKRRRWVVLVDGEPKQLRAVKAEAWRAGVKVTILADVVHVIEYIWNAARPAVFPRAWRPLSVVRRSREWMRRVSRSATPRSPAGGSEGLLDGEASRSLNRAIARRRQSRGSGRRPDRSARSVPCRTHDEGPHAGDRSLRRRQSG
jgi:hypothetical protein